MSNLECQHGPPTCTGTKAVTMSASYLAGAGFSLTCSYYVRACHCDLLYYGP